MTLITHIWTKDFNIIGADTRRKSVDGSAYQYNDDARKLFLGKNFVVGVHGDFYVNGINDLSKHLQGFINKNYGDTAIDFSVKLLNHFKYLGKELETGFIIGSRLDNKPEAYYINNYLAQITFDHLSDTTILSLASRDFHHPMRFNFTVDNDSASFSSLIIQFNSALAKNTDEKGISYQTYDDIDKTTWLNVIKDFYKLIFTGGNRLHDGIGGQLEYVIITNSGIEQSWT